MGEPVTIWRASNSARWEQARKRPRGLERDVNAPIRLGAYQRENREPVHLTAIVAAERASNRKRESGEIREASLSMKTDCQVFITDNATSDYADIVEIRGEYWKIRTVNFDRTGGLYVASLGKMSDDESVDIGVERTYRKHAT